MSPEPPSLVKGLAAALCQSFFVIVSRRCSPLWDGRAEWRSALRTTGPCLQLEVEESVFNEERRAIDLGKACEHEGKTVTTKRLARAARVRCHGGHAGYMERATQSACKASSFSTPGVRRCKRERPAAQLESAPAFTTDLLVFTIVPHAAGEDPLPYMAPTWASAGRHRQFL